MASAGTRYVYGTEYFQAKTYFPGIWIESTINSKPWKYRWQAEGSIQGTTVGQNIRKKTVMIRREVENWSAGEGRDPTEAVPKTSLLKAKKNAPLPIDSMWLNDCSQEDAPGYLVGPSGLLTTYPLLIFHSASAISLLKAPDEPISDVLLLDASLLFRSAALSSFSSIPCNEILLSKMIHEFQSSDSWDRNPKLRWQP